MSEGGTHWRVKFRVERRKGERAPRGRDRAEVAKGAARLAHRQRWLVCDLYRADNINAPLKFYKELGRIRKIYVEVEEARAEFWREVVDGIANLLLDLSEDFDSPDARRVEAQVVATVKRAANMEGGLFRNFADPNERHELDPVLRRVAEEYTEEMMHKGERPEGLRSLLPESERRGLSALIRKSRKKSNS